MELILGHAGTNHIDAQEMRNLFAGVVGEGSYILRGMEASVVSANQVRISEGGGIVQGAYFETASGAESVTIDNGTQGLKRHDLICAEYSITGGIENMELVVVKGTPSATPQDPSCTTGKISSGATVQFPFYRVRLDGLSIDGIDTIAPNRVFEASHEKIGIWECTKYSDGRAYASTSNYKFSADGGAYPRGALFYVHSTTLQMPTGFFTSVQRSSIAAASSPPWIYFGRNVFSTTQLSWYAAKAVDNWAGGNKADIEVWGRWK